jgi:hypothetical protein
MTDFLWLPPDLSLRHRPSNRIVRLAPLVPKPRVKLTRVHNAFAPPQLRSFAGDAGQAGQGQQGQSTDAHRMTGSHYAGAAPHTRVFSFENEFCGHSGRPVGT